MRNERLMLAAGVLLFAAAGAPAQEVNEAANVSEEAARQEVAMERELERATADIERAAREIEEAIRVGEVADVDVEIEMRDAESRLAEAAARVAELSTQRLPNFTSRTFAAEFAGRPVLGVSIDSRGGDSPVEGVEIVGVTPGGAAEEAGLRTGDIITAINDESMAAASQEQANAKLLDFMKGVKEGDALDVDYLRAGKAGQVTVEPRAVEHRFFSFNGGGPNVTLVPFPPNPAAAPQVSNRFVFISEAGGLGDLEMVALTEGLGRYFGTEKGLLVVRAPEDADTYKLQDGDVILNIDGREPNSVSHAVRILGSYQSGETLEIRIMRDKRARTLEVTMPEHTTGALRGRAPVVANVPAAAVPPVDAPAPGAPRP